MSDYNEQDYRPYQYLGTDEAGNPVTLTGYEAIRLRNPKNWNKLSHVLGHECEICGTVYPDTRLVRSGTKYYCTVLECYKDLA